jgi:hypothetical protein
MLLDNTAYAYIFNTFIISLDITILQAQNLYSIQFVGASSEINEKINKQLVVSTTDAYLLLLKQNFTTHAFNKFTVCR